MKGFRRFLKSLTPAFWIMQGPYSDDWDKTLNRLLDEHTFTEQDGFTCKLGNLQIWIQNYPYSCFHPYVPRLDVRAKRTTIIRAREQYERDMLRSTYDQLAVKGLIESAYKEGSR